MFVVPWGQRRQRPDQDKPDQKLQFRLCLAPLPHRSFRKEAFHSWGAEATVESTGGQRRGAGLGVNGKCLHPQSIMSPEKGPWQQRDHGRGLLVRSF